MHFQPFSRAVVTATFALLMVACPGLLSCSTPYGPVSEMESAAFIRAARDVYPDDVRDNPGLYRETLVAWVGVVRRCEVTREDDATVLRFDLEHRYFDWIEDIGIQEARYFLSPRGEGTFRAAWAMPPEFFDEAQSLIHKGVMLVVYGYPNEVRDGVIGFYPTDYVRWIPAEGFTDKRLDYGRVGDE